ncbi:MAG: hypothetical protein AAGU77_14240, partial [Bacillota bacterium]
MFDYTDHAGLWQETLSGFMPEKVFDCHVHIGPAGAVGPIADERKKVALTTYTNLGWPEAQEIYGLL